MTVIVWEFWERNGNEMGMKWELDQIVIILPESIITKRQRG